MSFHRDITNKKLVLEASSDNDQYKWSEINKALSSVGLIPSQIIKVLRALKNKTKG
jgi:hypothetical protein